jgi:hypothetical protein
VASSHRGPLAGEWALEEGADPVIDVLHSLLTVLLLIPDKPMARTDHRPAVGTPLTHASWITETRAFSDVFRGSRSGGK